MAALMLASGGSAGINAGIYAGIYAGIDEAGATESDF
jgi:hypothetical protein